MKRILFSVLFAGYLIKNHSDQQREYIRSNYGKNPLRNRSPPIGRHNIKIPCVIRDLAFYRQAVFRHIVLTLGKNNLISTASVIRPDLITEICLT